MPNPCLAAKAMAEVYWIRSVQPCPEGEAYPSLEGMPSRLSCCMLSSIPPTSVALGGASAGGKGRVAL